MSQTKLVDFQSTILGLTGTTVFQSLTYMLIINDHALVACGLVRANVLVNAPVTSPETSHTPYTSA